MDFAFSLNVARNSMIQLLLISGPILGVGMVVGLIVSIFQATTSIQEQTLTFVPKIAAILAILFFLGPWMGQTMIEFTKTIFSYIPQVVL